LEGVLETQNKMNQLNRIWNHLIWFFDQNPKLIISIQYLATLLLCYINYDDSYYTISNVLGYSIFTNLLIAKKVWKMTSFKGMITKSMLLSLFLSNIFSILERFVTREYYENIFDRYFLIATTVIIFLILKNKNERISN